MNIDRLKYIIYYVTENAMKERVINQGFSRESVHGEN